jgi:hypothetical protein
MNRYLRGFVSSVFLALVSSVVMAYDIHITKASEWTESAKSPITEDQWKAAVLADGELKMDDTASATNPKTKETVQIINPLMASWIDPKTKNKHYFYYSRGKVTVKNPSNSAIKKMKSVASKLGAKVQGDEGELY